MARRSTRTAAANAETSKDETSKDEATAETQETAATVTVTARQAIRHDGRRHAAGDTFEVTAATRDALKAVGAIE